MFKDNPDVYFKVVTESCQSLGLRKNPNIMQFKLNSWKHEPNNRIDNSNNDCGGIWVVSKIYNARKLKKYMFDKHQEPTRIFKVLIKNVLYKTHIGLKQMV